MLTSLKMKFLLAVGLLGLTSPILLAQEILDMYYPASVVAASPPASEGRVSRPRVDTKLRLRANAPPIFGIANPWIQILDGSIDLRLRYAHLSAEAVAHCNPIGLPTILRANLVAPRLTTLTDGRDCGVDPPPGQSVLGYREFSDTFTFGAPARRKTWDGMEFDASAMVHQRNGEPWLTTYWGYRMGLVESKFEWNETRLRTLPAFNGWPSYATEENELALATLPSPVTDGIVTEYLNTENFPNAPGGSYFYASNEEERAFLDAGTPGKWFRTGKNFKHGGYVAVCRFYGSVSPGPNSHFYTASDQECNLLKSLEIKPRPPSKQQFNFENKSFYANVPIPAKTAGQAPTCPVDSIPLYRAYNLAYGPTGKRNYDSNHRFSTTRADIDEVVAKGWSDEGIVMCVPR